MIRLILLALFLFAAACYSYPIYEIRPEILSEPPYQNDPDPDEGIPDEPYPDDNETESRLHSGEFVASGKAKSERCLRVLTICVGWVLAHV
jgi:hypothetical protein